MARCWTCGAHIDRPLFACPACSTVKEIQGLRKETAASLDRLAEVQRCGFEELSGALLEGLSEIASVIEWGFEEINWRLQQQTEVLKSIDRTLKTPSQTQANEWRQMAEELRSRGVLERSEEFFLKSLGANPLDYRAYVGLAEVYLQINTFDKAMAYLEESLPHAPKGRNQSQKQDWEDELDREADEIERELRELEGLEREAFEIGEEANYRANSRQNKEYFDYKSYSYRLIGHIHACKEEYPSAVSALRSAVELSPTYCLAIYDFAQYSAQVRDKETCVSMLKEAIDADIFYFYLAEKESNFTPLSREVGNLLDEISTDASDRAKAEITKAQGMISDAENSIAEAEEAMRKCPNRSELLSSSYRALEDAKSKVGMAESKVALKDYRASLEAIPIAEQACILANRAKKEAVEKTAYYKNERSIRLTSAIITPLWVIPLIMIAGAFLGSLGGCAIGVFSRSVSTSGGAEACAILGAVAGLFFGIRNTISEFRDVNNVK